MNRQHQVIILVSAFLNIDDGRGSNVKSVISVVCGLHTHTQTGTHTHIGIHTNRHTHTGSLEI